MEVWIRNGKCEAPQVKPDRITASHHSVSLTADYLNTLLPSGFSQRSDQLSVKE